MDNITILRRCEILSTELKEMRRKHFVLVESIPDPDAIYHYNSMLKIHNLGWGFNEGAD